MRIVIGAGRAEDSGYTLFFNNAEPVGIYPDGDGLSLSKSVSAIQKVWKLQDYRLPGVLFGDGKCMRGAFFHYLSEGTL